MRHQVRTIFAPFMLALVVCIVLVSAGENFDRAFAGLFLGEVIFARDFSKKVVALEQARGAVFPYRERLPFLPIGAGMLAYVAIGLDGLPTSFVPVVGSIAAAVIAAGKLWLSRGALWPYPKLAGTAD